MINVDVIVPAYNAERTIEQTLSSIQGQTLKPKKIIVIDDGSKDLTGEIVRRFRVQIPNLILIESTNYGVAHARNLGIKEATADLIAPIDADDIWHPTFLEKLSTSLNKAGEETAFAYAHSRRIDMSNNVIADCNRYATNGYAVNRLFVANVVGNGSAIMFRRKFACEIGGYDQRLHLILGTQGCEDMLFQWRLASCGMVITVPEYLVGYRRVPDAMSTDGRRMLLSQLNSIRLMMATPSCHKCKAARWMLGTTYAACSLNQAKYRYSLSALQFLYRALRYDPIGTAYVVYRSFSIRCSSLHSTLFRSGDIASDRLKIPFYSYDVKQGHSKSMPILQRWRFSRALRSDKIAHKNLSVRIYHERSTAHYRSDPRAHKQFID